MPSFGEEQAYLAAERTYLAYVRTALALFVAGLSLVRFFDKSPFILTGWALTILGLLCYVIGIYRWQASKNRIQQLSKSTN